MKDVFARLGADFFSTILFIAIYLATDNVLLATGVAIAGYAWAALCFVLGAGTIGVAMTGDMKLWTFYVTVVLVGAKIAAFAIQYIAFRVLVGGRIRAAAQRA